VDAGGSPGEVHRRVWEALEGFFTAVEGAGAQ
jgi:hypothetical protein